MLISGHSPPSPHHAWNEPKLRFESVTYVRLAVGAHGEYAVIVGAEAVGRGYCECEFAGVEAVFVGHGVEPSFGAAFLAFFVEASEVAAKYCRLGEIGHCGAHLSDVVVERVAVAALGAFLAVEASFAVFGVEIADDVAVFVAVLALDIEGSVSVGIEA